jgi:hypothetical protein
MRTLLCRLFRSLARIIRGTLHLSPRFRLVELGGQVTEIGDAEEVVREDSDEDVEEDEGEHDAEIPVALLVFFNSMK